MLENDDNPLIYEPSKTGQLFHDSDAVFRCILGPVGSGKSVTCIMDLFYSAMHMPKCKDGIRRSRWAIIRNTYPELRLTTIATWKVWFPERECGRIPKVSPIVQHMKFDDVDAEFWFIALDGEDDSRKLLSSEFTGFYFNELREISSVIIDYAMTRLGRYPSKAMLPTGVTYRSFIIADTNAPDEESWIVTRFIKHKNEFQDYILFTQPAPLIEINEHEYIENPEAENIEHLQDGYNYYHRIRRNSSRAVFEVTVMCKFISLFDGLPVYSEYNEKIHRTTYEIMPNKNETLYVGWDFGRTPCAVIGQYIKGQFLMLDEVICSENISLDEFVNVFFMPVITSEKYSDMKIVSVCDPSGVRKNDTDDNYCIKVLNKFGFNAKKAKTNDLTPRLETVKKLLTSLAMGEPACLMSVTCKISHEAYKGGYKYKMIRDAAGRKVPSLEPDKGDKNPYTHPADAWQYIKLECCFILKKKIEQKKVYVNGRMI